MTTLKLISLLSMAAFVVSGCGESNSSDAGPDFGGGNSAPVASNFDRKVLISNLTDNVITPVYQQAHSEAITLVEHLGSFCDAQQTVLAGGSSEQRDQAQQLVQTQWLATMAWWQQAEMMQIGPLLESNSSLRNKIYSWPVVNRCAVDQEVLFFEAGEINGTPYDITLRTDTRKGLDALEYLLFSPTLAHQCPATVAPVAWNDRSDDDRILARCLYSQAAAEDLVNNLATLNERWSQFADEIKQAGEPNNSFATVHEAINRISDALFYLDSLTKDAKLNSPLQQFSSNCDEECAAALESGLSESSLSNVGNNLLAFKALFAGNEGIGFDDYLQDIGSNALAQQMLADIDNAIANQAALGASLAQQLNQSVSQVEQLHNDTKAVTDALKVDFITELALDLPITSAGDND